MVSGIALFENLLFSLAILLSRSGSNFINWFVPICSIVSLAYSVMIFMYLLRGKHDGLFSKPITAFGLLYGVMNLVVRIYVIIKLGEAFSKPENYTS